MIKDVLKGQTRHLACKAWLGLLAVLLAGSAVAQQRTVSFDPDNTKIEFTLGAVLHNVHGAFKLKNGVIRFDPTTGAASGALVIDANSGESSNKSRDEKMHAEVLESRKYPEIIFVPQKVEGSTPLQGSSQVKVQGLLRMHGSEHPLTLVVRISINGAHIAANTQFVFPYENWGLKNPSTFILRVSNRVEINVTANGVIE